MKKIITVIKKTIKRPDSKRKLIIGSIFIVSYILSLINFIQQGGSIPAGGSILGLTIVLFSTWPKVKEFIWPSGLENVAANELSLACHSWKNFYFLIDHDLKNRIKTAEGDNIWDKILSASHHECNIENVARYKPLFVDQAIRTRDQIDSVILRYSDVLSDELRVLARHAIERLYLAPQSYPSVIKDLSNIAFFNQFKQVIKALSELDGPAHDLQTRTNPN